MARVAEVHFSYYPQDVRPRRESEALVESGMSVHTICLRHADEPAEEIVGGVHVHRLSMRKIRAGKLNYLLQYLSFIIRSFIKLTHLHYRERFNIVHVHNMPDILVLAALIPKLCGSGIILDLHDPMPELYMTKYSIEKDHWIIRLLCFLEKQSIRFADIVLTPNKSFRELFISRGCPKEKIFIVMNSPMEKIFNQGKDIPSQSEHESNNRFVIMYHGGIFERSGIDIGLEAIASLRTEIPNLEFRVFGSGDYTEKFQKLVEDHGLQNIVKYFGSVPLETISQEIRSINVGIIPNKKNAFTDLNFPVRIFEYLSLSKPVIVPKTQGIQDYFDEDSIFFFEAGNTESLAKIILDIYRKPSLTNQVIERSIRVYNQYRWELQRKILVKLVKGLANCKKPL